MLEALKNKDIRNKLIFTILMLVIFSIGSNIPVLGMDKSTISEIFTGENNGLFDLYNLFTGGSFQNFTIFAVGITPYITASIIIQLLTISFDYFEKLSHEGETGRKKMATITRYLTVVLAFIQSLGITLGLFKQALIDSSILTLSVVIFSLVTGTVFLMWLGEQINEYGIGNGISLIIFAGIVNRLPIDVNNIIMQVKEGTISFITAIFILICAIIIVMAIIYVQGGIRKIPVQYSKRTVGRKVYGGQNTHIPIKVNSSGVIPIIFALSVLQLPITITYFSPNSGFSEFVQKYMSTQGNPGVYIYTALNMLLIILFTYFYTSVVFKPDVISDNLKNAGGSIPAIRPGKPTEEYIKHVSNRLCLVDSLFLAVVASLPILISAFTPLNLTFGGTSLLILIGVALDLVKQINNRQIMNRYEGFLK